jgi:hypothetical protein
VGRRASRIARQVTPCAAVPVTVTHQANHWMVVEWDLSAYTSGDIGGGIRVDPASGYEVEGEILGNFEIDYVRLTAIPEPATLGLLPLMARRRLRRGR